MRDLTNPLQNWLYSRDDTVLHSVCSMPLNSLSSLAISLRGTAAVCVMSFTAVWICPAFTGYIAVCFWYIASICKPRVWWINPAWRATQADTKSSCNRSSLQINHYWFWIQKIFSFVSFGVFLWCFHPVNLCVFVCEFIWAPELYQGYIFWLRYFSKEINNLNHDAYKSMLILWYVFTFCRKCLWIGLIIS